MHDLPQRTERSGDTLAQRDSPGTLLPCCVTGLGWTCRQVLSLGSLKLGVRMTMELLCYHSLTTGMIQDLDKSNSDYSEEAHGSS